MKTKECFLVIEYEGDGSSNIWGLYEDIADAEKAKRHGPIRQVNHHYPEASDEARAKVAAERARHWSVEPIRLHRKGDSSTDFED